MTNAYPNLWPIAIGGVISLLIAILGFILSSLWAQLLKKLNEISSKLEHFALTLAQQSEHIRVLQEGQNQVQGRLNNHGERIRMLEMKDRSLPIRKPDTNTENDV